MKPSEKINKMLLEAIQRDKVDPNDQTNVNMILLCAMQIQMMLDYLDEEWEKNKPCEHKNKSPMGDADGPYKSCNDCHIVLNDE